MFVAKQRITLTKRQIVLAALLAAGVVVGWRLLAYLTEDAALLKVLKLDARGRRVSAR
jgi:hypothetical protein